MKDEIILSVNNLKKSFNNQKKSEAFLAQILNIVLGKQITSEKQDVIKNISLNLKRGEKLGIIGGNGSGKSTLLRLISGIYQADGGEIKSQEEVIYINGFNIGLKPRLSMEDNIRFIATIMGLNAKQIKKKIKEIEIFAELDGLGKRKIYTFSYGMIRRLCFSISIHCLEEKKYGIILFDEVFGSGGDWKFEEKALKRIENLIKQNLSVIIVSHDLDVIKNYCDRAILLQKGELKTEGKPKEVIEAYLSGKYS